MARTLQRLIGSSVVLALASIASAAFVPGNLVVTRLGDGTAVLSSAANPVTLVEYNTTPLSPSVSTLSLNSTGAANKLTMSGSATSEGALTLSADGRFLSLAGYNAAAGTAAIAGTTSATVNRVAGLVDSNGNADLSTLFATNYNQNNIRSAVSSNGATNWTTGAGATGGLCYSDTGGTNQAQLNSLNTRVVNIYSNNLYVSSASGQNVGINLVNGGLATTGPQTLTLLPGTNVSGTGTPSPYDFWFADPTTLYVADDRTTANGGGIQKWLFNAGLGVWQLQYTLADALLGNSGFRSLAGTRDVNGAVVLYAITGETSSTAATRLTSVVDLGAASPITVLQTAPTNTAFRGVDFAPVPEPTTIALFGLGALLLRRRTNA